MDKEKLETKNSKQPPWKDVSISDPRVRLKYLSDYASTVEMDRNNPPHRYYRSGVEMLRMADMCMKDNDLEYAYLLYVKFITIFLEKIRNHPQFHTVPLKDKKQNEQTLRKVIPKAEELKKQLLEQYQTEFNEYLGDMKEKERIEKERLKQEELERLREEEKKNKLAALAAVKAAKIAASENVVAPEENKIKKISNISPKPLVQLVSPGSDVTAQTSKENKPNIDRSTKPSLLCDNFILRDIVLPTKLMHNFLMLAFTNTMNNKETCGILAGKLERNKLLVTHLLIPEQTGSPDSCVTHNEEDIFDYQDQHNLITLGWIHTHPTQTAFLSSVDLHTHCAYQLMMAEAIAIVCAPKYDETGYFILTPEYGLEFIANCRETGFHPHPNDPPLYMKAKHCKLDTTAIIEVVDLRRK
ncbi:STAM-binding protein-like A [Habropoda laboriosa]|uniref:STAM-binding protein-like A n=1 Tax=Habropoda laboriosa TaxID=597456 RepID=A0A0L7QLL9_9HYME|nr:PREDICTED: STAM-binding protein-like A [Habropoda laboriosa]KOC59444.1 STAM-binding protein-like A [Habropoda laboriosa]